MIRTRSREEIHGKYHRIRSETKLTKLQKAILYAPPTCHQRIVFPYDEESESYSCKDFPPKGFRGDLSVFEVKQVIHQIKKISLKTHKEVQCLYIFTLLINGLLLTLMFIYLIVWRHYLGLELLEKEMKEIKLNYQLLEALEVILLPIFVLCIMVLMCLCSVSTIKGRERISQIKIDRYLHNLMKYQFWKKGIEWKVGKYRAWLEVSVPKKEEEKKEKENMV